MNIPRIIYADDDVGSLRLVDELAKESGKFHVTCVTNGEELLTQLRILPPNTYSGVIIDMNLGMGALGNIVAEEVKKINERMPVAILSNYDIGFVKELSEDIEFWYKPDLTNDDLLNKIINMLYSKNYN